MVTGPELGRWLLCWKWVGAYQAGSRLAQVDAGVSVDL